MKSLFAARRLAGRGILSRQFLQLKTTPRAAFSVTRQAQAAKKCSRPVWLQQLFHDKKIYFEDVSHVKKCFLNGVSSDETKFSFAFPSAPDEEFRKFAVDYLALRAACRCPECYDARPQQRTHLLMDIDLDEKPASWNFDSESQLLHVTWASDGHKSVYSGPAIYANFTRHPLFENSKKKLWKAAEYMENFQVFDFERMCNEEKSMMDFLVALDEYGLVKISNAPLRTGALHELSEHISYIRRTHYGETFLVENKPDVTNLAYSAGKLLLHIDLPYFEYMPGVQMLHCVRNSKVGGDSTFSDAFAVADWIRKNKPAYFDALTTSTLRFVDCTTDANDAFLMQKRPPITLAADGSVQCVRYNNGTYDCARQMPPEEQRLFLEALRCFIRMNESPEYQLEVKLNGGEIIVFDNRRATHGRSAFDPTEKRLLEGCYFDWDEVYSRIRIIRSKLFRQKLAAHMDGCC